MRNICLIVLIAVLTVTAKCQVLQRGYVATVGNSVARYQQGFNWYEFPQEPSWFAGQDGFTCSQLQQIIPYMVPRGATVAVLYDLTNDVRLNTPVNQVIGCLANTIAGLWARNPELQVIIPNEHPFTEDNCVGDRRDYIDALNAALPALAGPQVTTVDVWTPNVLPDGSRWADPQYMTGFCGVHPGPALQWSPSWAHFVQPVQQGVRQVKP